MYNYLVTPRWVLGSDSFYVQANNDLDAIIAAKARITREGWECCNGWEILKEVAIID